MTATFAAPRAQAEAFTHHEEGSYWPGGAGDPNPTDQGVTQRHYDAWRLAQGLSERPVLEISPDEVTAIYDTYWAAGRCEDVAGISSALSVVHFDACFNGGGAVLLQRAAELPPEDQDGIIGPRTMAAVSAAVVADPDATIERYLQARLLRYRSLANWPEWGRAWSTRLNNLAAFVGSLWRVT